MDLEEVNVLPLYGDNMLDHHGIGHAVVNNGQITQIRCGIFAQNAPVPTPNQDYVITGKMKVNGTRQDFKVTLRCTTAGRPQSTFDLPPRI